MKEGYTLAELEQVYEKCLSVPPEERDKLIDQTCGNRESLKTILREMLKSEDTAIAYFQELQQSLAGGWSPGEIPTLEQGEVVGNYRVDSLLGKGGMSNVYLAERCDGEFEQRVAIKCFPARSVRVRKENVKKAEQQILAGLQHPNIARLLDAGITGNGILYFIMEFVDGEAVDTYLKRMKPATSGRLALFKEVVKAVAFAHSRFTLHLDLKPSNIFVNSLGQIKLLDFGISMKLNEDENHEPGTFFGTPSIAAPEQLAGQPLSAATDIYQLGILLHTVLSGTSPVRSYAASTEQLTRIGPLTDTPELQISSAIPAEPASIIAKCTQANPDERYNSAADLLQDVKRLEEGYPLFAMPQSNGYRLKKYIRRNRLQVISFSLIILSLLAGLMASLWQAREATEQRDKAVQNEQVATLTKNFLSNLFREADPSFAQGDTLTVFQLLEKGHQQLSGYNGPAAIKLELLNTISSSYRNMGDYDNAGKVLNQAENLALDSMLTISPPFIRNVVQMGLYQRDIGNYDSSAILLNRALNLYEKIDYPREDSMYTDVLKRLAYVYKNKSKFDSAEYLMKETIALEENIWPDHYNIQLAESYYIQAAIYVDLKQYDEAIIYQKKSLDLCERIMGSNFPGTLANLNLLSGLLKSNGNAEEALPYNRKAKRIAENIYGKKHAETATNTYNLAHTFSALDQYDSAHFYFSKALAIQNDVYKDEFNSWHISSYNALIALFIKMNNLDSAQYYVNKTLTVSESPKISTQKRAKAYDWAGEYYQKAGDLQEARNYLQLALAEYISYLDSTSRLVVLTSKKVDALDSLLQVQ